MMKSIPDQIKAINAQLSRCKLVIHSQRLYVRSSKFPPKPGSNSKRPELATGYKAIARELPYAKAIALQVEGQLLLGTFDWAPWVKDSLKQAETVGQWLSQLEANYFARRGRGPKSETTWRYTYQIYYERLASDQVLTEELLKNDLMSIKAGSRSRQMASMAYGFLADFAGIPRREISELGKGYRQPKKTAKDILLDGQIEFQIENISSLAWKNAAALLAVFGLRNHEIFRADLTRIREGVIYISKETKTEDRTAYACPMEWVEKFNLHPLMKMPKVSLDRANRSLGQTVTTAFKRHGLNNPYAFRDAYAVRLLLADVPAAIASRWMGHSTGVHDRNYLDAIQEIHHEEMFARLKEKTNANRQS